MATAPIHSLGTARIASTADGTVLFALSRGLLALSDKGGKQTPRWILNQPAQAVHVDRKGVAWIAAGTKLLNWHQDSLTESTVKNLPSRAWTRIDSDRDGNVWLAEDHLIVEIDRSTNSGVVQADHLPVMRDLYPDPVLGMVVSTSQGLAIRDGGKWQLLAELSQ
jgi:hypothetical protein